MALLCTWIGGHFAVALLSSVRAINCRSTFCDSQVQAFAMEAYEDFIREKVEKERWTHQRVASYLQQANPAERGLSLRTVERFCTEKGISKLTPIPDDHLDRVVATSISKVGPTYGRKMMKGMLTSHGIHVAEKRLASSMQRMNPSHHQARCTATESQTNPQPYHADYFGHKLHVDQNEKLAMFGVTHIAAIDGYSAKIVGFVTMPIKNNLEIYEHLYRYVI